MTFAAEFDFVTVTAETEQEAREALQDMLRRREVGFELRAVDWEKGKNGNTKTGCN